MQDLDAGYFAAMRIPLIRGHSFEEMTVEDARWELVVPAGDQVDPVRVLNAQ